MTDLASAAPSDAEIDAQWRESVEKHETTAAFVRDFARAVLAKFGTPAVAGEPVAWLSTDCIGERYLCFTKPNDSDPARPLVFGDTTPQPTQAQAGAVPLTADEVDDMAFGYCPSGNIGELRDLIHAVQERLGIKKENGHGLPT